MLRAEVWTYLVVVSAAAMLYLEAIVDLLLLLYEGSMTRRAVCLAVFYLLLSFNMT